MSLAEELPRSYMGSLSRSTAPKLSRMSLAELAGKAAPEPSVPRRGSPEDLSARAPEPVAKEPAAVLPLAKRVERVERTEKAKEADNSLDLLDRASKGMSFILGRYKQLEDHVKQVDSWSHAQIEAAEAAAAQWQQTAALTEKRLEECQRSLEIMVRRAEAAEQCMHRDKEALTVLQDRIIQAFGFGSEAHEALNATMSLA